MSDSIRDEVTAVLDELLNEARLSAGDVFVLGCSTSEVTGGKIGKSSSMDAARVIYSVLYPRLVQAGVFLAAQCCEHLNRALVIERELAVRDRLEIVNAVPQIHAGGSSATVAFSLFKDPVLVEHIKAQAGMDIGGTLIGMHLSDTAVPVHTAQRTIGSACVVCARTRPKYIGGERAVYNTEMM